MKNKIKFISKKNGNNIKNERRRNILFMQNNIKLGLALAGGGMRGFAHIGALKAFEEEKIKIDAIGGTSAGGLVASLYALGYTPYYIYILFKEYAKEIVTIGTTPIINSIGTYVTSKKLKLTGFQTGEKIEKMYNELAQKKGVAVVKDIKMPIAIPAIDINNAEEYVFTNFVPNISNRKKYIKYITVGKSLRASSSFPVMFCPCEFENHKFLDGGAVENIPISSVKDLGADKVIAINFKTGDINNESNVVDIVMKTIDIMGNKIIEKDMKKSDLTLTVNMNKLDIFNMDDLEKSYMDGYNLVKQNIDKIRNVLNTKNEDNIF